MRDEKEDIMKGSRIKQQKQKGRNRTRRLKMWAEEDETWKKKSLINLWNETSVLTCCRVHFFGKGFACKNFITFIFINFVADWIQI